MTPANPSLNETRRLEARRTYAVRDTLQEEALGELTTLAATICEAPILP